MTLYAVTFCETTESKQDNNTDSLELFLFFLKYCLIFFLAMKIIWGGVVGRIFKILNLVTTSPPQRPYLLLPTFKKDPPYFPAVFTNLNFKLEIER